MVEKEVFGRTDLVRHTLATYKILTDSKIMDKKFYIILLGLLLSSCATILNNSVQKISITTDKRIKVVSVDNSMKIFGNKNSFYVGRSKNPIKLNLLVDTTRQNIFVKSHSSVAYWANIYFNYGIGMLIDKDNSKRYAYPKRMYLRLKDNKVIINRFAPTRKGTIDWHIALPHVNFFHIATNNGYRSSGGFWGIESGLDYFYQDNRFISVYGGAATDFFVPVPAAVDIRGMHQSSSGFFVSARNNYRVGSFDLGYGISYSRLNWRMTNNIDSTFIPQTKHNSAFELSFISAFRFGQYFQLGLLYQPYFISIDNRIKTDYQHQISIELIWKIPLRQTLSN